MLPETLRLADAHRTEIIEHCLKGAPNEACGLIATSEGSVKKVYGTANADESPAGYTVPPQEHFQALTDAEKRGWQIGGVFHSHPDGPARPSRIDVQSALDPEWIYLVVGMSDDPELRAWRIREKEISEVVLV